MDRAFKLWIAPSLLGLVVAAVLGFLLAELWQAVAVGVDNLDRQVYERAMEDRVYHDRIMAEVSGATDTLLLAVAAVVWGTAMAWFAACWRTPVAEVGAVRRLRSRWGLTLSGRIGPRLPGGRLRRRVGLPTLRPDHASPVAPALPVPPALLRPDLLRDRGALYAPGVPPRTSLEQVAHVANLMGAALLRRRLFRLFIGVFARGRSLFGSFCAGTAPRTAPTRLFRAASPA